MKVVAAVGIFGCLFVLLAHTLPLLGEFGLLLAVFAGVVLVVLVEYVDPFVDVILSGVD